MAPVSEAARTWLVPFKARVQGWLGPAASEGCGSGAGGEGGQQQSEAAAAGGGGGGATAEFQRRLQKRLAKKGGEASAIG